MLFHIPHGKPLTRCATCQKRTLQIDGGNGLIWIDYDNKNGAAEEFGTFPLRRPQLLCTRQDCPLLTSKENHDELV
jgi:hypothetical protein